MLLPDGQWHRLQRIILIETYNFLTVSLFEWNLVLNHDDCYEIFMYVQKISERVIQKLVFFHWGRYRDNPGHWCHLKFTRWITAPDALNSSITEGCLFLFSSFFPSTQLFVGQLRNFTTNLKLLSISKTKLSGNRVIMGCVIRKT